MPGRPWTPNSSYTIFEGTSEIQRLIISRAISGVHIARSYKEFTARLAAGAERAGGLFLGQRQFGASRQNSTGRPRGC